jgi:hypothetical protein
MHNFIDNKIRIIQIRSEKSKNCHGISLWIYNLDKKVSREFSKKIIHCSQMDTSLI